MAGAVCAVLLAAGCTGQVRDEAPSRPSESGASPYPASAQRSRLLDIPRGAPPASGWFRGATIWSPGAEAPIHLELTGRERAGSVVPYRDGYLMRVRQRGAPGRGVVFDSDGQRVRRLDGCVGGQGPVSSTGPGLVAWISRDCGGSGARTLWVAPGRGKDGDQPDLSMSLPAWDEPARPSAVGEWGVSVQLDDGIRGYPTEVYVAEPSTGAIRQVTGTTELVAVSAAGVACCVRSSLVDLETGDLTGRAPAIEAFSPDGTQGIVSRGAGRRVDVVDTTTGEVLRTVELPQRIDVGVARWEDSRNLLFEVGRYDAEGGAYYSTIVRATPSGAVERVTGVTRGDPHVL